MPRSALLLAPLLTALLGIGVQSAHAAGFEPKTMRDPLAAREVERGLVLGKGWLEFGLGTDVKTATGYWDSEGVAQDFEHATWTWTTQRLDLRYGISRRGQLYWSIRTHYAHLQNDLLGTDTSAFGLGDPVFGYSLELFRSMAPVTSAVVFAEYKAPAGNESPGGYIGGANTFTDVVMTTGTPDLALGARVKRQIGPLALKVGAQRVFRMGNTVQYAIETDQSQFAGRIKPGDLTSVDGNLLVQAGPLALQGTVVATLRSDTRVGTTSKGLFGNNNLSRVEDSGGWSLDLTPGAVINLSRGLDLDLALTLPLRGEDLMFFPIEDIHPTRGATYSGTVKFRY